MAQTNQNQQCTRDIIPAISQAFVATTHLRPVLYHRHRHCHSPAHIHLVRRSRARPNTSMHLNPGQKGLGIIFFMIISCNVIPNMTLQLILWLSHTSTQFISLKQSNPMTSLELGMALLLRSAYQASTLGCIQNGEKRRLARYLHC